MSLPVATTITGMDTWTCCTRTWRWRRDSSPCRRGDAGAARAVQEQAADGRFELYKVSLKFDNPEARLAHGFPLDTQSVEVKEMLQTTKNTGYPFPKAG